MPPRATRPSAALSETYSLPRRSLAVEAMARARSRGQLRPGVDLSMIVDQLWGACYHRLLLPGEPITHDFADALVENALDGAAPGKGARPPRVVSGVDALGADDLVVAHVVEHGVDLLRIDALPLGEGLPVERELELLRLQVVRVPRSLAGLPVDDAIAAVDEKDRIQLADDDPVIQHQVDLDLHLDRLERGELRARAREARAAAAALWLMAERWSPEPAMVRRATGSSPTDRQIPRTDTGPVFISSLTYTRARGARRRARSG